MHDNYQKSNRNCHLLWTLYLTANMYKVSLDLELSPPISHVSLTQVEFTVNYLCPARLKQRMLLGLSSETEVEIWEI